MMKYLVGIVLAALSALLVQVLPQQAAPLTGTSISGSARLESQVLSGRKLIGPALVIDGDTIEIAGRRIRLEGIDAPETHQMCQTAHGEPWPAGRIAATYLERTVRAHLVNCHTMGEDGYGRILARCSANGRDINAAMIRTGMAWAFRKYSKIYIEDEAIARRAGAGVWAAHCRTAWEYRANRWQHAEGGAPAGCAIKGNITRRGRIYHMPWSPWYGRTRIEVKRGERWFCNERQALDAGWRPAVVR